MMLKYSLFALALALMGTTNVDAFAPLHHHQSLSIATSSTTSSTTVLFGKKKKNKNDEDKEEQDDNDKDKPGKRAKHDPKLEMLRQQLEMQWQMQNPQPPHGHGHGPPHPHHGPHGNNINNGIGEPQFDSLLGPPPPPPPSHPHPQFGMEPPVFDRQEINPMEGGPFWVGDRQQPTDWIQQRIAQDEHDWINFGKQATHDWNIRNGYMPPPPSQTQGGQNIPPMQQWSQPKPSMPPQQPGPQPRPGHQTAHEQIMPMPKGNDKSPRDQMFRIHNQLKNHPAFANDVLFADQQMQPHHPNMMMPQEYTEDDFVDDMPFRDDSWIQQDFEAQGPPVFGTLEQQQRAARGHEPILPMPKGPQGKKQSARDQMFRLHYQLKNHPNFQDDVLFGDHDDPHNDDSLFSPPPMGGDEPGPHGFFNDGPPPPRNDDDDEQRPYWGI